jgi:hypothetical protein
MTKYQDESGLCSPQSAADDKRSICIQITLEHPGWENLVGDLGNELAGWFASGVATLLLSTICPTPWAIESPIARCGGRPVGVLTHQGLGRAKN